MELLTLFVEDEERVLDDTDLDEDNEDVELDELSSRFPAIPRMAKSTVIG